MSFVCNKCGKILKNLTGFKQHKKFCVLSKNKIQEIKSLYLSGLLLTEIIKKGYSKKNIVFYIKDIKRKHNASKNLKKSYLIGTRKKITSNTFGIEKYQCVKCKRFFKLTKLEIYILLVCLLVKL
jgi:DNA-directed RNA polymerase subunit RPC12/RpoP